LAFDTWTESGGEHELSVRAIDGAGNVATSPYELTLDDAKPNVDVSGSLLASQGDLLTERFSSVDVAASEAAGSGQSGLAALEIYVDDVPALQDAFSCSPGCPSTGGTSYQYDRDAWASGGHMVYILATDYAGNIGSEAVVANYGDPPDPTLTCPTVAGAGTSSSQVTPAAAEATFEASFPEAVDASVAFDDPETDEYYDPSLLDDEPTELITGTGPEGWVADEISNGHAVGDAICVRPADASVSASPGEFVSGGDAMLFANTQDATDTLVRPAAAGSMVIGQIRSDEAPSEFELALDLAPNQQLEELSNGSVAITQAPADPEDAPIPGSDPAETPGTATDPGLEPPPGYDDPTLAPDAEAQEAVGDFLLSEAQRATSDDVVAVIAAPAGIDEDGDPVDSSVSAQGETVTVQLAHGAVGTNYPAYYKADIVTRGGNYQCKIHARYPWKNRHDPVGGAPPRPVIWYQGKIWCKRSYDRPERIVIHTELRQRKAALFYHFWDNVQDTNVISHDDVYKNGIRDADNCRKDDEKHEFQAYIKGGAELQYGNIINGDDESRSEWFKCDQ
jgi:hypothetical protein